MKKNVIVLLFFVPILLSGCVEQSISINIFNQYLVLPFRAAIEYLAVMLNYNYGLAIILLTFMIRFALLPLMMDQFKKQKKFRDKMDLARPEIEKLQSLLKETTDKEHKKLIKQEMIYTYKSYDISPFSVGCLPLIIQMPILMGFYYAIKYTEHIGHSTFLWFSLGESDWIITLIAGFIYFLQFKLTQSNFPKNQQNQLQHIGIFSPIMIIIISSNAPSAIPLYWAFGGLFLIIQNLFCRKLYF